MHRRDILRGAGAAALASTLPLGARAANSLPLAAPVHVGSVGLRTRDAEALSRWYGDPARPQPSRTGLSAPVPVPGEGRPAYPRRLGPGSRDSRAAPRPDGNRRGPARSPLDPDHKPAAGCSLTRRDRRTDIRRCHPRSPGPQCPSPRARRTVIAPLERHHRNR